MDQFRNLLVSLIAPQDSLQDMSERARKALRDQAELAGLEKLQRALSLLIAREADLRLTSHPRLVLETILIRLCRMGEVLSFDELIKKIESLEKRLSVSPHDRIDPVAHLSDPGSEWEIQEKGKGVSGHGWDDLLDYLSSKNGPMANVLKEWQLLKLTDDTLEIGRGHNSFSSGYLDEPERLDKLAGYCREFFKRDLKIKIVDNSQENNKKRDLPAQKPLDLRGEKSSDGLPRPVQDILQIFQGEIREEGSAKDLKKKDPGEA
jgi:DNA polymerase-3 subunit gamma/tau